MEARAWQCRGTGGKMDGNRECIGVTGTIFDIAVVGGGIAGLTAAHHATLSGASVAHFVEHGFE